MRNQSAQIRKLIYSAVFLAIAQVLPFITGQIPQVGRMLCPMHIPVLLCGFVCGWPWGLAVGFIAPLMRSALFGMPVMFPPAVSMAFELATYGLVAGLLYSRLPRGIGWSYIVLLCSMCCGRLVYGLVMFLIMAAQGSAYTLAAFWSAAVAGSVPGIIVQLLIIPAIVAAMAKSGLVPNDRQPR